MAETFAELLVHLAGALGALVGLLGFAGAWVIEHFGLPVFIVLVIAIYMAPWFIARRRAHPNATAIGALALLLGWTGIGWVAALVWALTETPYTRWRRERAKTR